ncbi:pentapeptide repeat-containing protein [Paenibacillus thermotolerans]|uniref:pentapeptide repeat-containing protein n=1 Tax=Paenibacillus thermotolerans TaxID=3027807 RepID=UPI0023688714|nr:MULTISPECIES: pentapeptide repeat-containing protein [unclassified Paenibacillus]
MNEKLRDYLDRVFARYEGLPPVMEIKEELYRDLQEKLADLKREGYDDEAALQLAIDSIGDISELVESMNATARELQQSVGMDLSKSNLQRMDFREVQVPGGKFNYSNLQGSDFTHSDLTNSTFKCSNLDRAVFDGANLTGAKLIKSNLRRASFRDCVLDRTDFSSSELSGVNFDGLSFNGTIFDYSGLKGTSFRNAIFKNVSFKTDVKKAIFDGAAMDKVTYALLKGFKANLTNVTTL